MMLSHQPKAVMLCIESEFDTSRPAFCWALQNLVGEEDTVHVVTAVAPAPCSLQEEGGGGAEDKQGEDRERREAHRREIMAVDGLKQAAEAIKEMGTSLRRPIKTHTVTGSKPADALTKFAASHGVDLMVVGSRGFGAVRRNLLSAIGLGSVSDRCVHENRCAVAVVRSNCLEDYKVHLSPRARDLGDAERREAASPPLAPPLAPLGKNKRRICLAHDASECSKAMLRWAAESLLMETDQVYVVSVAAPKTEQVLPFVQELADVSTSTGGPTNQAAEDAVVKAEGLAGDAVQELLADGGRFDKIWYKGLPHLPVFCGAGASICEYLQQNHVNMLVVGSRGLGSFSRAASSWMGVGSVSDYCTHNAPCPVIVYKASK